ncbi:CS1 type fimbrial major subunit [Chromobacterium haemolyticum]|uniref:CS1 type fimbrial major subunit n=1 Tax=Chromobacterium haemolyticum TaxID=394935 RepID=UPI0009DB6202|nr:CS1 type fimbrial major subunit [Chromobacterium haemolyticum]OQS31373.1 hypothetical protein B0T39_24305 [Chromobacterium haemolyticum]
MIKKLILCSALSMFAVGAFATESVDRVFNVTTDISSRLDVRARGGGLLDTNVTMVHTPNVGLNAKLVEFEAVTNIQDKGMKVSLFQEPFLIDATGEKRIKLGVAIGTQPITMGAPVTVAANGFVNGLHVNNIIISDASPAVAESNSLHQAKGKAVSGVYTGKVYLRFEMES